MAQANAEINALQHTIMGSLSAEEKATLSATLTPFQQSLVGNNQKPLLILLAAVAGLLLVGCVNITNLLLARAVGSGNRWRWLRPWERAAARCCAWHMRETTSAGRPGWCAGHSAGDDDDAGHAALPSSGAGFPRTTCIWTGQAPAAPFCWRCWQRCWQAQHRHG